VKHPAVTAALVGALALPALAACTDSTTARGGGDPRTITVAAGDTSCDLSADRAPSGNLVYKVTNRGAKVTEFYLYGEDGRRIVGEVENVGPGLSRDLVLNVPAGTYIPACKPGMVGQGIRSTFTVTESESESESGSGSGSGQTPATSGATQQQIDRATARYHRYVQKQSEDLLAGTRRFVAAYTAGDDNEARSLYAPTRVHWERIEPVAESFGDLDPRMDLRQADLEQGQSWTGWHRIEKDLWPPRSGYTALTSKQRAAYGDRLLADTRTLVTRVKRLGFTIDQMGNGAKSLLDEVAKSKVTGEEEAWSHTDLYDFAANVDGARAGFEDLEPILARKDATLKDQIEQRFTDLQKVLDRHRSGPHGFVSYTTLSQAQVRQLSDAVNALSEPLSKLTAAVTL
jgi:iron uptake system component EfeO